MSVDPTVMEGVARVAAGLPANAAGLYVSVKIGNCLYSTGLLTPTSPLSIGTFKRTV